MQGYGKQAIVQMILESLPQLAAEISAPLQKVDDIILLGDGKNTTNELAKLLAEVPVTVKALTGTDVSGVIKKLPGAR